MVELQLEALDFKSAAADTYVAVRVGENQKLSRLAEVRNFKFPQSSIGDRKFGKVDVFKRVGSGSVCVRHDPDNKVQELKVECNEGVTHNFRVTLSGELSPSGKALGGHPAIDEAKGYLVQHNLEMILSDAMQAVLRERPDNPSQFIAEKLRKSEGTYRKVPSEARPQTAPDDVSRELQRTGVSAPAPAAGNADATQNGNLSYGVDPFTMLRESIKAEDLTDTVVTLAPYFKVKDLEKFKSIWQEDYAKFAHKEDCVHYAFTFTDDNRAHCREGYPNAEKVLQHLADVDVPFKAVLDPAVAELERLEMHGPAAELEKLKPTFTPLGCLFYTAEWGGRPAKPAMAEDAVCHLYPFFTLKQPDEFKKIWYDAWPDTKANMEAEKTHQYSFSFEPTANVASCRESYGDADGILLHLGNVDKPLKAALAGPAELLRLELHAPASEIEKLRPALEPLGCQFFTIGWGFRNATISKEAQKAKTEEMRKKAKQSLLDGKANGKLDAALANARNK